MLKLRLNLGKSIECCGEWQLAMTGIFRKAALVRSEGRGFQHVQHHRLPRRTMARQVGPTEEVAVNEGDVLAFGNAAVLITRVTPAGADLTFLASPDVRFLRQELIGQPARRVAAEL